MFDALFGGRPKSFTSRDKERFATPGISCGLGDVIDLSVSGMKVRCHKRPPLSVGDEIDASISSETQRISVHGRVVWLKRNGISGATVGIRFVNIRPGIAAALEQLGQYGFISVDAASAAAEQKPQASQAPVRAAIEIEDLYAILGVSPAASPAEIRASYHRLAKELHPDHNPTAEAATRFADVAKAYRVLRDESMRRRYDEMVASCDVSPRSKSNAA